jgi:IclR family pca regulon transcriptional regulator
MSQPPPAINPKDLIEGLAKGLRMIEAFDADHPRLTPSQAALRAGITRTAARRHLLTLQHLGYAETDGRLFWLTPRVLRLGDGFREGTRLPRLVQPYIQQLSAKVGETVNFSVLDGHEVLYLARSNSPRIVSIGFHPGDRAPAHTVAPGVVLAASLGDAALEQWVAGHPFTSYTARTVTTAARFLQQVRSARERGYWVLEQQLDNGFSGAAIAITDRRGRCHGAVGLTMQASLWPHEAVEERLVPALQATAQNLRGVL